MSLRIVQIHSVWAITWVSANFQRYDFVHGSRTLLWQCISFFVTFPPAICLWWILCTVYPSPPNWIQISAIILYNSISSKLLIFNVCISNRYEALVQARTVSIKQQAKPFHFQNKHVSASLCLSHSFSSYTKFYATMKYSKRGSNIMLREI